MAQYANQKRIIINRDEIDFKSSKQYLQAYTENVSLASRTLGGEVPFKLYIYLLSNRNGFNLDFSPQHFANVYGCSTKAAKNAVAALEEAGYITHDINNRYEFHEIPQVTTSRVIIDESHEEKRLVPVNDESGARIYKELTYSQVWRELKDSYSEETIKAFWNNLEVI